MSIYKSFSRFLLTLAFVSPLAVATVNSAIAADLEPVRWLFVQNAAGGTLSGPDSQHLTLKLREVSPDSLVFSDRPVRKARQLPISAYIGAWAKIYSNDPPNATLNYRLPGKSRPLNLVLTLSNPRYDAAKHALFYDAAVIHDSILLKDHVTSVPVKIPSKFTSASLFIDDDTTWQIISEGLETAAEWCEVLCEFLI